MAVWVDRNHIGVPRILQWMGFMWRGPGKRIWGTAIPSPNEVQGQSPDRGSGGCSPQKAEAKCEIGVQFLSFPV